MEEVNRFGIAAVFTAHAQFQARLRASPFRRRDLDEPAYAVRVDGLERRHREHALVEIGSEHRGFDVITGESPVVWVRSLVPKEKKSAASAIRCAVSAALGSSIIVPIGMSSENPLSAATSARIASDSSRTRWSSITEPTNGTMISTFGDFPTAS